MSELIKFCKKTHVYKGQCVLSRGHDGPCVYEKPEATGPRVEKQPNGMLHAVKD